MYISDVEAIQNILQEKNRYVCFLGAGASAEARVMTAQQICKEIHDKLLKANSVPRDKQEEWANKELKWDRPHARYATCIRRRYRVPAQRVAYFRNILRNVRPAFCHHGVALLMRAHYFKTTCVTTNFDKLLESAFTQQGELECQPIRTIEEVEFWQQEWDRYHVMKLHGDYDTYNILNTADETLEINAGMIGAVEELLKSAGIIVIGAAGHEESIYSMFKSLTLKATDVNKVLSWGLLWGVYMGQPRPKGIAQSELEELIKEQIRQGVVSARIEQLIEEKNPSNALFCFFPVWSAGVFLSDLINATHDEDLIRESEFYLDHEMRLRTVFARANLSEEAIAKHIAKLKESQEKMAQKSSKGIQRPDLAFKIRLKNSEIEIRAMYGDISDRLLMEDQEFKQLVRTVLSPEDTCLTAGGGAALALLNKAGKHTILNELAKFSPIRQGSVAVTSGGNLPIHYIFHAAALEIKEDGNYLITKQSVRQTMTAALDKALALGVGVLWVPLLGAGTAGLKPQESLSAILEAVSTWDRQDHKMIIMVFVYPKKVYSRPDFRRCVQQTMGSGIDIVPFN